MARRDDRIRDLHKDHRDTYIDMVESRDSGVRAEKWAEIHRIQRELTGVLEGGV